MLLKTSKNLLQIYLFFYGAVLPGKSCFVLFFILCFNIHHLVKATKLNCSLQSLVRVVIVEVFMSQFYIEFH